MGSYSFLCIDDHPGDREIVRELCASIGGIKVDIIDSLPDIDRCNAYDGLIVDENLGGDSGIDFARQVSAKNFMTPIILLTGLDSQAPSILDAKTYVDYVCSKDDFNDFILTLNAVMRNINRVRQAQKMAWSDFG